MNYKFAIIFLLVLVGAKSSFSQQSVQSFKQIVEGGKIGKTYVHKSVTDSTWRTYLGSITDSITKSTLHVISEFEKVRAAETWHGHSNVFLVNHNGKMAYWILFGMPDELPFQLKNNELYFKDGTKTIKAPFKLVAKNLFCLYSTRCYEVIKEYSKP